MWRFGFSVLYFAFFKSCYLIFRLTFWIPVSILRELKLPKLARLTNQSFNIHLPAAPRTFEFLENYISVQISPSPGQKTARSPWESIGVKYPGVNSRGVETSIGQIKLILVLQSDHRYRAFNKHRRPTKHVGLLFFPPKLEAGNKVLN